MTTRPPQRRRAEPARTKSGRSWPGIGSVVASGRVEIRLAVSEASRRATTGSGGVIGSPRSIRDTEPAREPAGNPVPGQLAARDR